MPAYYLPWHAWLVHCRSTVRLSHCVKCRNCHTARADSSRKRALCRRNRRTSSSSWCWCRCEATASASSAATLGARPHPHTTLLAAPLATAVFPTVALLVTATLLVNGVLGLPTMGPFPLVSVLCGTSGHASGTGSVAILSRDGSVLSIDGY